MNKNYIIKKMNYINLLIMDLLELLGFSLIIIIIILSFSLVNKFLFIFGIYLLICYLLYKLFQLFI